MSRKRDRRPEAVNVEKFWLIQPYVMENSPLVLI
jgi:hypothetical protein